MPSGLIANACTASSSRTVTCELIEDESTAESASKFELELEINSDTSGVYFSNVNATVKVADFGDACFADNDALVGALFTPLVTARSPRVLLAW